MTSANAFIEDYQNNYLNQFPPLPEELCDSYSYYSCRKDTSDKQIYILIHNRNSKKFLLKSTLANSSESVKKEYDVIKNLRESGCNGIPNVYGFYSFGDRDYLLEEYIPGNTLYDHIEAGRNFSVSEIIYIGMQLCDILTIFHHSEPSIIHRDISPKNIILSANNKVTIIDMGIARAYHQNKGEDTYVSGTPVTAPPEQFGYGQTDARSDIYSLGALLYYLYQKNFNISSASLAQIPKGLSHIIQKCTSFSPEMRYHNTTELKVKLEKLSESLKYTVNRNVFLSHYRRLWGLSVLLLLLLITSFYTIHQLKNSLSFYSAPVSLHSSKIEEAVRKELKLSATAPITRYDLQHVYHIAICGDTVYDEETPYEYETDENRLNYKSYNEKGSIQDLSDFSLMKNLSSLSLPNQIITDISPIKDLPLKELVLSANSISNFSPIADMTSLETLIIGGNKAADYYFLDNLTALKTLNLDKLKLDNLKFLTKYNLDWLSLNGIELNDRDYSPILTQKNLKELRIENCNIKVTSYINQLRGLLYLRYSGSPISSLQELSDLSGLLQLHLHNTELSSLQDITLFPHLEYLGIADTKITDISPIINLKELNGLDINRCNIKDYSPITTMQLDNLWCSDEQRKLIGQ